MSIKELMVAAIEHGTVIDHIQAGQAMNIVKILSLQPKNRSVLIGLNLPSVKLGVKDLIKVESDDWHLTKKETSRIAVLAPQATVTLIKDYEPIEKYSVEMPPALEDIADCPNKQCITNHEPMATFFFVRPFAKKIELECRYCRKCFSHNQIKSYRV
jgi:aspartate carbamoyltransferase regulatory subunit